MSINIQLLEHLIIYESTKPDIYYYDPNQFNEPEESFIISRDYTGKILSTYGDNSWNLTPYASNLSQKYTLYFNKDLLNKRNINEFKKLFFLIMAIGSTKFNTGYSIGTLISIYKLLSYISIFAEKNDTTLFKLLACNLKIKSFIVDYRKKRKNVYILSTILIFYIN